MADPITLISYVVAIIVAVLFAPFLHEGGHYLVGWLGNSDPNFHTTLFIIPSGVSHRNIETMDATLIRFSGFTPFLWIPVWVMTTVFFLLDFTPTRCLMMLIPFFTILMSSESDAMAFRAPEEYRKTAMGDGFDRNPIFLPNWLPG